MENNNDIKTVGIAENSSDIFTSVPNELHQDQQNSSLISRNQSSDSIQEINDTLGSDVHTKYTDANSSDGENDLEDSPQHIELISNKIDNAVSIEGKLTLDANGIEIGEDQNQNNSSSIAEISYALPSKNNSTFINTPDNPMLDNSDAQTDASANSTANGINEMPHLNSTGHT